eukprot:4223718-Pyramimonas_sp.AAC.1
MEAMLPLLAPSGSFAVFSPWMQPLVDCMDKLQRGRQAVGLQLTEPWYREHQVLCLTVLFCAVLYCTVLYCTVLYCTSEVVNGHKVSAGNFVRRKR